MKTVSRLEIIVSSMEVPKILEVLDKTGVAVYSVIRDVVGKGLFGTVSDDMDFASSSLSNAYIISFCPPENLTQVVDAIRPVINKYGGVCYLSEAQEIRSIQCIAKF